MNALAAVLLSATLLGAERRVTPPAFGPAFGTQVPHALASDGKEFLAVWTGTGGLYAAAVDENGNARPTPPRALATGTIGAHAAWNGDAYVLAWFDQERSMTLTARLGRNAELLAPPSAVPLPGRPVPMALAASPDGTLLVAGTDDGVKAVLLETNASVVLPATTRPHVASAVAVSGGFVVITAETSFAGGRSETIVRATRITSAGTVERSAKIVDSMPNYVQTVHAATAGERVGVAFVSQRNTYNGEDRLRTFTLDAQSLAATVHPFVVVLGDGPQVVAIPGGFAAGLLEYTETSPLTLTTIPFGETSRRTMQLTTVPGADLHMATNGSRVLGIWRDYRLSPPFERSVLSTFGVALDATAAIPQSEVVPIAISAITQSLPQIASSGSTALLAWVDLTKTASGDLLVTRIDSRGSHLDRRPLVVASDVTRWDPPAVVYTGEVWIVGWYVRLDASGRTRAYMRRVSRDGTFLDAAPVDLGEGGVVGASNGTVTLLIVGDSVLRFSPSGELLGRDVLPQTAGFSREIASNGREFLFVWNEGSDWWQFPDPNLIDVRAIRFDANGIPMDAAPIDIAVSPANEVQPFVTSNGEDFLVLFEHHAASDAVTVRAKRVLASGVLADHTAISEGNVVAEGEAVFAAVPRDDGYLAVVARNVDGLRMNIEAIALDDRGTPVEAPAPLGTSERWRTSVAAAGTWIVYTRTVPSLGDIERLFVRVVGEGGTRRRTIRR